MKRLLIGLGIWLCATPVLAQTSLLPTLERIRLEYPTPMSPEQHGEYLNRVAWEHRNEGWGLLRKDGGNRCPAPQGVYVACDILVYAPNPWHFDVLIDSGVSDIPAWIDKGPCVLSPTSGCEMGHFVLPVPSGPNTPTGLRVVR